MALSWLLVMSALAQPLEMVVGDLHQLSTPSAIERVAIADGQVIETRSLEDNAVLLVALRPGHTQLWVWHAEGVQQHSVLVSTQPPQSLLYLLGALSEQDPALSWRTLNGQVVAQGPVAAATASQLQQLAERYAQLELMLSAQPSSAASIIELEVQVVELKTRHLQSMGIAWQNVLDGPAVGIVSDWVGGTHFRVGGAENMGAATLRPGHYAYAGLASALTSQLHVLEQQGQARLLASPLLRTESGQSARFLAGGEVPVPQTNMQGQMDVTFRAYGIQLEIAPQLLDDGAVRTEVFSEVSNLDPAVSVAGIPGLLTRRTQSLVAVPQGETFVISGLLNEERAHSEQKLPGASSVPLLGQLFRQRQMQQQDTELAIFITPRVVDNDAAMARQRQARIERIQQQLRREPCRGMRNYLQ